MSKFRCERCFGPSDAPVCDAPKCQQSALEDVRMKRMRDLGLGPQPPGSNPAIVVIDARNQVARWQMIGLGALLTLTVEFLAIVAIAYF